MGNLTYTQRKKHLNNLTGFPNLEAYNIQMPYIENKANHSLKEYRPIYLSTIKGVCRLNKAITLSELVKHLLTYTGAGNNTILPVLIGKIKHTIEYLENAGYLRYLPDTDGELTFCNYKYFEEIHG